MFKFPSKKLYINLTSFLIENFKAFSERLTGSGLRKREMRQILLRKLCSTENVPILALAGLEKIAESWLKFLLALRYGCVSRM